MLPPKVAAKRTGGRAEDVKGLLPVAVLMVATFLLLLFWENELQEEGAAAAAALELRHVDFPRSHVSRRYCNRLIQQRVLRGPGGACKEEHVFIHERPGKVHRVCASPETAACGNRSGALCFRSETRFRMTVCRLLEGARYPACRYRASPVEAFLLLACDRSGPVELQSYVE